MKRAMVLAGLVVMLLLTGTASGAPLPSERAGSGNEPTQGGGLFAVKPYRARAAVIHWSSVSETLELYLLRGPTSCGSFEHDVARPGPLVQVDVIQGKQKTIPLGSPVPQSGFVGTELAWPAVEFQIYDARGYPAPAHAATGHGLQIVFTRVDTTKGGIWHGRVQLKAQRIGGKTYSYDGTFAAYWC